MKLLDIALKDVLRSLRSRFILVMIFVVPLLITGLIYFAFSGLAGGEGGFDIPVTKVQVANLDQPSPQFGGFSVGQEILDILRSEDLAGILEVNKAADVASARTAVEEQRAAVAVIIPEGFTAALFSPEGRSTIILYQDPTLTLGPGIVRDILRQLIDGFAGARIASDVLVAQFAEQGQSLTPQLRQQVIAQFGTWAENLGRTLSEGDMASSPLKLEIESPPGQRKAANQMAALIGPIMLGQMIFFTFYTGAFTAESIIREDEERTLPRLFTTPTPRTAILGGKFVSVFLHTIGQVIFLLIISALMFKVNWGKPLSILIMSSALVVSAAGSGVFIMSFVRNTRQAGPVLGGVLTILGMAGGLFTANFTLPAAFNTISLFTPHGWAMRGWKLVLGGASLGEMFLPLMVSLGFGIVFFVAGALLFRRRYT